MTYAIHVLTCDLNLRFFVYIWLFKTISYLSRWKSIKSSKKQFDICPAAPTKIYKDLQVGGFEGSFWFDAFLCRKDFSEFLKTLYVLGSFSNNRRLLL